jgi:hypothetical protein
MGPRQGLDPLYRRGAAAVAHGARALPPCAAALGLQPPWAVAIGNLVLWGTTAGTWPHRPILPTAGVTPNAVPHGGRCTFLENFDSIIYFWNRDKINIKNSFVVLAIKSL